MAATNHENATTGGAVCQYSTILDTHTPRAEERMTYAYPFIPHRFTWCWRRRRESHSTVTAHMTSRAPPAAGLERTALDNLDHPMTPACDHCCLLTHWSLQPPIALPNNGRTRLITARTTACRPCRGLAGRMYPDGPHTRVMPHATATGKPPHCRDQLNQRAEEEGCCFV